MYVQIIQYEHTGDGEAFMASAEKLAPIIAELDGFVAKLWLGGPDERFGGVYLWRDRDAADRYRSGDLFTEGLVEAPDVCNLTVIGYELWASPTGQTSGGLPIAV